MNEEKSIKWYLIFDLLSKALLEHYEKYVSDGHLASGEQLYRILMANEKFRQHHPWIKKFDEEFGVKSVDPIHLFASFNSGSSPVRNRTIRIEAIFKALNIAVKFEKIDFDGCPAPQALKILSARNSNEQAEIWDLFHRAYINGLNGIRDVDFDRYKYWYGIELPSFTIFLYWIRSDEFLPIDRNTRTLLTASRVIEYTPKDYHNYYQLMQQLRHFNLAYLSSDYGDHGLYREITHIAYKIVKQGVKTVSYSLVLRNILQSVGLLPDEGTHNKPALPPIPPQQIFDKITEVGKLAHLGLKLIAIRPGAKCNPSFLNVLKPGQLYQFETTITIDNNDTITYNEIEQLQLYDISRGDDDPLRINVTAIVGKNGSGKSSLVELLFRIINNIAYNYKDQLKTEDLQEIRGLEAELFYLINGKLFCLEIIDTAISVQEFELEENMFKIHAPKRPFTFNDFQNWFYTVAVNYSIYPLNSAHIGDWIRDLFHKNDSYQTPLVINPMRTKGVITSISRTI